MTLPSSLTSTPQKLLHSILNDSLLVHIYYIYLCVRVCVGKQVNIRWENHPFNPIIVKVRSAYLIFRSTNSDFFHSESVNDASEMTACSLNDLTVFVNISRKWSKLHTRNTSVGRTVILPNGSDALNSARSFVKRWIIQSHLRPLSIDVSTDLLNCTADNYNHNHI